MPALYDYRCTKCGIEKVVSQSMTEYCKSPQLPEKEASCDCSFERFIKPKENGVKGFILLGEHGWHDKEYTRYRSIK